MGSAFKPNKRGLDQLQRDLQRELNKRSVYVRAEADPLMVFPPAATVNNYHGPVVTVTGDNAQIAWDNDTVNQAQTRVGQIAPGYEELARLVTDLLASLDTLSLDASDAEEVRTSSETVLGEVIKDEPDQGLVRRGVTMIKGLLAPVATGVGNAVTDEAAEAARHLIESLGQALPF